VRHRGTNRLESDVPVPKRPVEICWASVNDLKVGRNPKQVLRVLDALRTGGLRPCGWQRGQRTLAA
jgi:alkyl hydroperoxide reductase subunit AhpC